MIKIIHGSPQSVWMPISDGATIYVGSIVCVDSSAPSEGVVVREQADGAGDTTNKDVPLGVCIGTNLRTPLFSSTYNTHYITDEGVTGLRTSTTEYVGVEGMWGKGDKQAMVEVALINQGTVLEAPFFNNAVGTAPTLLTSTAGNANGLTVTTNASEVTGVDSMTTIYCRTGVNRGSYRVTDDTSTTVHAWDRQMLNTTATTGETYVKVPVRHSGMSYIRIGDDTVGSYINTSEAAATHYDIIHVIKLDLVTAGEEVCHFCFDGSTFNTVRA